jgi:hypothetical protein
VTGWVALVVPVLAVNVWVLVTTGPHLLATTSSTLRESAHRLSTQLHAFDVVPAAVTALSMVALSLPLLGLWVMATRVAGRVRQQLRTWAARGRGYRVAIALGLTAGVVTVLVTWLPEPEPVRTTPAASTASPATPTPTPTPSDAVPSPTGGAPTSAPWLLPLGPGPTR